MTVVLLWFITGKRDTTFLGISENRTSQFCFWYFAFYVTAMLFRLKVLFHCTLKFENTYFEFLEAFWFKMLNQEYPIKRIGRCQIRFVKDVYKRKNQHLLMSHIFIILIYENKMCIYLFIDVKHFYMTCWCSQCRFMGYEPISTDAC